MEKKEFSSRLRDVITKTENAFNGVKFESVASWMGQPVPNVFTYAAISERCMERQLNELKGMERQTTFMADLSIGEWCGVSSTLDTIKRAVSEWRDNETYMAEFVLCCNWKAWEHDARKNTQWTKFWSFVYEQILNLMYDYYGNDVVKQRYLWEYLD